MIVYDRLIQDNVLALASPSAERIYMGKPVGRHDSRQDEVNEVLVRKAREGKQVVRLKGGDPFVLGRGGEEAEYLAQRGVPYDVIPGISSAIAAPLHAGIPVTHRDVASCVVIATGHEAHRDEDRLDWAALSKLDTLVFLMGVHNVGRIASRLIEHGRDPATPAALIQMAYWPDERVLVSTLANIAAEAERAEVQAPATLVIGEVVRWRERLRTTPQEVLQPPEVSSHFAPLPDELIRLVTAARGVQVLRFALSCAMFDGLEQTRQPMELASILKLDATALAEILDALVSLGLLERCREGYRNLELASRYLTHSSPENSADSLLMQTELLADWSSLAQFARQGPPREAETSSGDFDGRYGEMWSRSAAPFVADKLDLMNHSTMMVVSCDDDAYCRAFSRRWPHLSINSCNPLAQPEVWKNLLNGGGPGHGPFGAIVLSGMLGCCDDRHLERLLGWACSRLKSNGLLALHDAVVPPCVAAPPEIVLGTLFRRIARGGSTIWSVCRVQDYFSKLGLHPPRLHPIPGGTTLISSQK